MTSLLAKRYFLRKFTIVNLLILIFLPLSLCAQFPVSDNLLFEKIYLENRIPFGFVESIQQDSIGFIWIGTKEGLIRYDGIRFRTYHFDREDTNSLSSNVVRKLFIDSRNNLWIATEFGLNLYNPKKDCFVRYLTNKKNPNAIPSNYITSIAEDKVGNLWMSTFDAGLFMYDTHNSKYTIYSQNSTSANHKISSNYLNTVYISKDGTIWIGTGAKGVDYFKPGFPIKSFIAGTKDGYHLAGNDVRCIIEDSSGNIWFGSNLNGISKFNPTTKKFTYHSALNSPDAIGGLIISSFFLDSHDRLWICTDGGGLNLYNKDSDSFTHYGLKKGADQGISSNVVRTVFEDRSGNLWIGNCNAPLNYINCHGKKFHTVHHINNCKECYRGNNISSIFIDSKGLIWLAIDGEGINVFDPHERKFSSYIQGKVASIPNNKPVCFTEDKDNNIWIGFFEGGISCFNRSSKSFINFFPDGTSNNLAGAQVWDLMADGDTIWIATEEGVNLYSIKNKKFSVIPIDSDSRKGTNASSIWRIIKDSKGRILIGTHNGLNVYDPSKQEFEYFESDMNNPQSLSDRWILNIFEDSKKRIWLGTNGGGLNLWNEPENKFKCFTTKDGLSGDIIYGIQEDDDNNLWISTNSGLTKFNYDLLRIETYNLKDGIQDDRFSLNASFRDKEGLLYFGGINGITYFKPSEIIADNYIPPVVITGLSLFNTPVKIGGPGSPLTNNILFQNEVRFSSKQSVFTFEFASLNYNQSEDNMYSFMLEGIDDDWRPASKKSFATYTHLKPGRYTFKVIGSNSDNIWNTKGSSIDIIINPPFYKSKVFIVLEVLIILLLLFLFYNLRNQSIRNVNLKLSSLVQERTILLEIKNKEIEEQNREILEQRDFATAQRDHIAKQNEELEVHRNKLSELVELKTNELNEAKMKAEKNDNLKTIFLEIINHEIRTPMNAILGFINLLNDQIDDPNSRSFYLKILKESGKNLLRLIEDITDFSRFHLGELKTSYVSCNINEIIRQIISSYRERASREKPEINILFDVPDEAVIINSDAKKIQQIFNHLVDNSFKYTEKGFIRVGIKEHNEDFITLCIEDSGISIANEHIEGFFMRFYHNSGENHDIQVRDSGLGLALSKHFVELLEGKIWIENTENGFAFFFSLPSNKRLISQSNPENEVGSSSYFWPGKRIIVAEDDETNFLLIEAIFKETGVELIHAEDGVEFLEIVEKNPKVDLVLLDIRMPRLNGLNAIKIVRELMKDVPVIAQTAYDHAYHREKAFESGCNHFLTKPLIKDELLNLVKTYLG